MAAPSCPIPAHAGSVVIKKGFAGRKPEHQRQRWLCRPVNGEPHIFTPRVPRRCAEEDRCAHCDHELARSDGPWTAPNYDYQLEKAVARSLFLVGQGLSYRKASLAVRADRDAAFFNPARVLRWVEVFAPILIGELGRRHWPELGTLVLDDLPLEGNANTKFFYVMGAWGYPQPGHGRSRLWRLSAHPDNAATLGMLDGGWSAFLKELPWRPVFDPATGQLVRANRPARIVCDQGKGIVPAVRRIWPAIRDARGTIVLPTPQITFCHWHLKQNLWNDYLTRIPAGRGGPKLDRMLNQLAVRADDAMEKRGQIFGDPEKWLTFCAAAWGRDPALDRWLLDHANRIAEELAWKVFPKSTAGLESALAQVRAWLEDRKSNFGNQARTLKLLSLMTLQLSHRADQDRYFRIIKDALEAGTVIQHQAISDDAWGTRSLWA